MPPPLHTRNHEILLLHLTGLSDSRHDLGWLQEYSQQKALHILTRMIPPALNYALRYYTIRDAKMYPYFRISCLFLKPMGCYGRFSFISTTWFCLLLHLARFPLYVLCLIYFPVVFLFDYHFPRYFFPRVFFSCYPHWWSLFGLRYLFCCTVLYNFVNEWRKNDDNLICIMVLHLHVVSCNVE